MLSVIYKFNITQHNSTEILSIFVLRIECLYLLQLVVYQFYVDVSQQGFISCSSLYCFINCHQSAYCISYIPCLIVRTVNFQHSKVNHALVICPNLAQKHPPLSCDFAHKKHSLLEYTASSGTASACVCNEDLKMS
jgi:hypothetical protein